MARGPKDRVEEDDDDMQVDTIPPSGMSTAVALRGAAAGTGGRTKQGETPVDKLPYEIRFPWRATENTICEYVYSGIMTGAGGLNSYIQRAFRLNSIYDIRVDSPDSGTTEITQGTSDTADAAGLIEVPMMREYWAQFYNYWTVRGCEWQIKLRPISSNNSPDEYAIAYVYKHGAQWPRVLNASSNLIPHKLRKLHPGVEWKEVYPQRVNVNTVWDSFANIQRNSYHKVNNRDSAVTFQGRYLPGSIEHEVVEDEQKQTWHKLTEVPPTREILQLLITPGPYSSHENIINTNNSNVGTYANLDFHIELEMKYHVQWKDLKLEYQYPASTDVLPSVNNYGQKKE